MNGIDFDFFTTSILKLIFAWGFVTILICCYVFCRLVATMLKNDELIKFVTKIGQYLLVFGLARFVSSILDFNSGFEIAVSTYIVHYTFWLLVFYRIYKFYTYLKDGFYIDQRRKETRLAKEKLDKVNLENIEFSQGVSLGFERQHRVSNIFRELIEELKFEDELKNSIG